jgi:ATP-dependent exoDNAse (exonuclease V) beta subunit
MSSTPPDFAIRAAALNPNASFIVQAPAGSGKTQLLTQRYLTLLAEAVNHPREILAITFTRKAAHEMRERLLSVLQQAHASTPSTELMLLAAKVLAKDRAMDWGLLQHPYQLRIMTIDAFCLSLVQSLPLAAGLGSHFTISEFPERLYTEAVQAFFDHADQRSPYYSALKQLLFHLDNDWERAGTLIENMLRIRDQWLPIVVQAQDRAREVLEQGFQSWWDEALQEIALHWKQIHRAYGEAFLFAAKNLQIDQLTVPEACFSNIDTNIKTFFQFLTKITLTQEGELRKSLDKRQGFPTSNIKTEKAELQSYKDRMFEFIKLLQEDPDLHAALLHLAGLPEPYYNEQQWQILAALLELLPLAVAELQYVFQTRQAVDFIEVAQRAYHALGSSEQPSELLLQLDLQMNHLLIDEFQDTSPAQFRLFERLTQAWNQADGKSIFLVGDPLQSIYRFRKAEVGLFLHLQKYGFNHFPLTAVHLQANFRSDARLLKHVNELFANLFCHQRYPASHSIPYLPAIAMRDYPVQGLAVTEQFSLENETQELQYLIQAIQAALQKFDSLAVLVRSKSHAGPIMAALKKHAIAFSATDILPTQLLLQDLYILTKALLSLWDRVAWLALLRSPICGLRYADIHTIANQTESCIWLSMQKVDRSQIEGSRLDRIIKVLEPLIDSSLRLRQRVERAWLQLGGPASVPDVSDLNLCQKYFLFLDRYFYDLIPDSATFEKYFQQMQLEQTISQEVKLQIMTIHKAKGLEFDAVFLPYLHRGARHDESALMLSLEEMHANKINFLMAPIRPRAQLEPDPIYAHLQKIHQQQQAQELKRLLYVAMTRAKRHLYLSATTSGSVAKNSLAALLGVQGENSVMPEHLSPPQVKPLQRVVYSNSLPQWKDANTTKAYATQGMNFLSQHAMERAYGIIIHRYFKRWADEGAMPSSISVDQITQQINLLVKPFHFSANETDLLSQRIVSCLQRVLICEYAQWIIQEDNEAYAEWPLLDTMGQSIILDRSFIIDGERWIIDYKLHWSHTDEASEHFIAQAIQNYQSQLQHYAQAVAQFETRPIRTALYFPDYGVLQEVRWV